MEKTRVAIIGGGIGGLTALHELAQEPNVDVHLFEASNRVGGRIQTVRFDDTSVDVGASYFHRHYHFFLDLLDEMGYTAQRKPFEKGRTGFLLDGQIIPLDTKGILGNALRGRISLADVSSLRRLKRDNRETVEDGNHALGSYADSITSDFADVLGDHPITQRGYATPFREYTDGLTRNVREGVVRPLTRFTLFTNPERLNAAIGRAIFADRTILETLDGGLEELPRKLYREHASFISLEAPVTRVTRCGDNGFAVESPAEPRGYKEFDAIVSAISLTRLQGISHEGVGIESSPLEYAGVRKLLVRGNLRSQYTGADTLIIGEGGTGVDQISRKGSFYKVSTLSERPQLNEFFTDYDIVHESHWTEGVPIIGAHSTIPRMRKEKGFYLVGDYALPCMEMAVATGYKAAEQVKIDFKI